MHPRQLAVEQLQAIGSATIKCAGNSMRPLIAPGQAIHLRKVPFEQLRTGDAVFVKIRGGLVVHLIGALQQDRALITNYNGHPNGWVGAGSIYGLCVRVDERVIVSEEKLQARINDP